MVVKEFSSLEGQALSKGKVSVGLPALRHAAWVPRASGRRRKLGPRVLGSQCGSGVVFILSLWAGSFCFTPAGKGSNWMRLVVFKFRCPFFEQNFMQNSETGVELHGFHVGGGHRPRMLSHTQHQQLRQRNKKGSCWPSRPMALARTVSPA